MFASEDPILEFRGPFGVPVQIGPSLILLAILMVDLTGGRQVLAYDLMFVLLLVGSILLHEAGHAWGSKIQGVAVGRIMLHGAGGFCDRSGHVNRTEEELIVAMGPMVNLALWAVASLVAPVIADPEIRWVFEALAWINLWLALFNLVPVQPLDGGKLLFLMLCRFMPAALALRLAGLVGLLASLVFLPMLLMSFWAFGLALFFLPSIPMHWQMLRGQAA